MPVTIGAPREPSYAEPVGLLTDCHRRVEMYLGVLVKLATEFEALPLGARERDSLAAALRYFREAAPKHTADEEESLFPRLRACSNAEIAEALAQMEQLEADHRQVAPLHAEVEKLAKEWLGGVRLGFTDACRLKELATQLADHYREHIRLEEQQLFPLAAKSLSSNALREVGEEMAARRGAIHRGR